MRHELLYPQDLISSKNFFDFKSLWFEIHFLCIFWLKNVDPIICAVTHGTKGSIDFPRYRHGCNKEILQGGGQPPVWTTVIRLKPNSSPKEQAFPGPEGSEILHYVRKESMFLLNRLLISNLEFQTAPSISKVFITIGYLDVWHWNSA